MAAAAVNSALAFGQGLAAGMPGGHLCSLMVAAGSLLAIPSGGLVSSKRNHSGLAFGIVSTLRKGFCEIALKYLVLNGSRLLS